MNKSEIKPGTHYAFRQNRKRLGTSLERVKVIELTRGSKWKVEWIDPNPGLIHYADSSQLVVPWSEHKAFLREEASARAIKEFNERHGFVNDSPLDTALNEVIDAAAEGLSFSRGCLSGPPEAIDRLKTRCGLTTGQHSPYSYVDRHGQLHLPYDQAVEIARRFCALEPQAVLLSIEATEQKWTHVAREPGGDYILPLFNEYRAAWALIRQWTGQDPAIAAREQRIEKLERLVWDAVYLLQRSGLDAESARLRRRLERT